MIRAFLDKDSADTRGSAILRDRGSSYLVWDGSALWPLFQCRTANPAVLDRTVKPLQIRTVMFKYSKSITPSQSTSSPVMHASQQQTDGDDSIRQGWSNKGPYDHIADNSTCKNDIEAIERVTDRQHHTFSFTSPLPSPSSPSLLSSEQYSSYAPFTIAPAVPARPLQSTLQVAPIPLTLVYALQTP